MYNLVERISCQLFGKYVNVIGHDYPSQQMIPLTIKMEQSILN